MKFLLVLLFVLRLFFLTSLVYNYIFLIDWILHFRFIFTLRKLEIFNVYVATNKNDVGNQTKGITTTVSATRR